MNETDALSPEAALQAVRDLIGVVAARGADDDAELVRELMQRGVGELEAELLVRVVPVAFGYLLLKAIGMATLPMTYMVFDARQSFVEFDLGREPAFKAAIQIGADALNSEFATGFTLATFQQIAQRAAAMDAVQQYLAAGHTVEELAAVRFKPVAFFGITAEQLASRRFP